MNQDIGTLLKGTTPERVPPLDVEAVHRRARRRRAIKRTGGGMVGLAIVVSVAVVALGGSADPSVRVEGPAGVVGAPSPSAPVSGAEAGGDLAQVEANWGGLSLQAAVDRLAAASEQGPQVALPPAPGTAVRWGRLYLTQESGYDGERASDELDTWTLNADERLIDADGVGWIQRGSASLTYPSGAVERARVRELAAQLQPVELGPRWRSGGGALHTATWADDLDQQVGELLRLLERDTTVDIGALAHAMLDTSARLELLRALPTLPGIRYDGVVTDLLGRPAVAFSLPFAPGEGADLDGVRSYLLLAPDDGQPRGWEYHDSAGTRIEWRAETLTTFELVEDFDPASVQDLPTQPVPRDAPTVSPGPE